MEPIQRRSQVVTFYSFKGGVGRTMALANIAWILASTGQRVLAVDWDLESPGLHRYFAPFLSDRDLRESPGVIEAIARFAEAASNDGQGRLDDGAIRRYARVKDFVTSLERYDFPHGGSIDFMPAGMQVPEYSRTVSTFDWDDFYIRLRGEDFLVALANDMRANYDIALIDSRTGLSDNAGICTITLPDTVVNCFSFSNQSIEGAVAIAREIDRHRSSGVRMYPVPTRVEDGEAAKLDRRRSLAQQRFSDYVDRLGYLDHSRYWGTVEVPYKVFYAYEETLAAFGDRPHQENTLLSAYERLASELVGQKITFSGIPESTRRGWLDEFEQRGSTIPGPILIAYIPRERIWAEWIQHELRNAGQLSRLRDLTAGGDPAEVLGEVDRMIMLLSRESMQHPSTPAWWDLALKRDAPGIGRFLTPVRIDGFRLLAPFDSREAIDMFRVPGHHAREALMSRLGIRDAPQTAGAPPTGGPRFPFEAAGVWRVPTRNTSFVGRDATLEELRERLKSSSAHTGPAVLQGIGGVGKTQIALEYLHRFAADYDVAWWIDADQPDLVVPALADLAQQLGLATTGRADEQAQAVVETLRRGVPSPKWIIVFDSADEPDKIEKFIPSGAGDVLVTTPGQEWSRRAWTLDVNVFDRSESIGLLTRRVGGLSHDEADAIAAKLGDLPLAVEQAAIWLAETAMSARNYLELLDEQLPRILNEPPPKGYRHPAATTWRLSQDRLRESNPAAAHVVELCAFLGPEPIPTSLLDSPAMIDVLAKYDPGLRDQLLRSRLIREISRYGLMRADYRENALRMHRLIQSVIQGSLTEESHLSRQEQIQVILANARPGEPADQRNWPEYQKLLPHLEPSHVIDSDDPEVHQLVIDMVRFLRYRGDLAGCQTLAKRTLESWVPRLGENNIAVLRLRSEFATALFTNGEYQDALTMHDNVAQRMTSTLGETHPYTLVALSGAAADHRGLGNYERARELDEQTFVRWQATMGDNNERTLMAANNLAVSHRLMGDFNEARQLDLETLRRRENLLTSKHLMTLNSLVSYGRDLREVGDLTQSRAVLERAQQDCHEELGPADSLTLAASKSLAVTLRRFGMLNEGRDIIAGAMANYIQQYGEHHPARLGGELEAACAESALGDHELARTHAEDILERYKEALGAKHPFSLAAANNLAIFLLRAGQHQTAAPILEDTVARFLEKLPPGHPYTLLCQMNLANAYFAAGDAADAMSLDEQCLAQLMRRFGNRSHPTLLAAEANLIVSRKATGDRGAAHSLQEDAVRLAEESLGVHHPHTESLRTGARINSDIEPPET